MERIKNILMAKAIIVIFLLVGSCSDNNSESKGVGNYLLYSELRLKEQDFEIILRVTHIEKDRYSFKEWFGDKLVNDDVFLIKENIVYDLSETKKLGDYSGDFKKYTKRNKVYNRID